jgi:hypothetical protein
MNHTLSKQDNQLAAAPVEETVAILDPRAPGGVTQYGGAEQFRTWAATISAGTKEEGKQNPTISRDGRIYLHEDMGPAPGIREALEQSGGKKLTVTMLSDRIGECLKQMFVCYDKVKIFGNEKALTVMKLDNDGNQMREVVHAAENPEKFQRLLSMCKPSTFVPFALAAWDEDQLPFMVWPDGFVPYRLRFGSINAARGFVESLQSIKKLTGGRLVGVPLELTLTYKWVMDPKLVRRQVPVWTVRLKHPSGMPMRTETIRNVLAAGIQDASVMALPASIEMEEEALFAHDERIESELDEAAVRKAVEGSVEERVQDYFRAMQGTPWATDEFRPDMVAKCAAAAGLVLDNPSLKELAEVATDEEWKAASETYTWAASQFHGTTQTGTKEARAQVGEVSDEELGFETLGGKDAVEEQIGSYARHAEPEPEPQPEPAAKPAARRRTSDDKEIAEYLKVNDFFAKEIDRVRADLAAAGCRDIDAWLAARMREGKSPFLIKEAAKAFDPLLEE